MFTLPTLLQSPKTKILGTLALAAASLAFTAPSASARTIYLPQPVLVRAPITALAPTCAVIVPQPVFIQPYRHDLRFFHPDRHDRRDRHDQHDFHHH